MATDYPSIIKYFYKEPSFENYIQVRKYIDPRIITKKNKYKIHFALCLYIIHMKYPTYDIL